MLNLLKLKHVLFLLHFVKHFGKIWQLTEHSGIVAGSPNFLGEMGNLQMLLLKIKI